MSGEGGEMAEREKARRYLRNRYGREFADAELHELIKRETGEHRYTDEWIEQWNHPGLPAGVKFKLPTWGATREADD